MEVKQQDKNRKMISRTCGYYYQIVICYKAVPVTTIRMTENKFNFNI